MQDANKLTKDFKGLRRGFSTGSVSAAAIKASIRYYFNSGIFSEIEIKMPGGEICALKLDFIDKIVFNNKDGDNSIISRTIVKKDSGDDPDVTDGIKIYADFTSLLIPEKPDLEDITKRIPDYLKDFYETNLIACPPQSTVSLQPAKSVWPISNLSLYNTMEYPEYTVLLLSSNGIGIVKRPGLPVKPGLPAINPVPYKMIENAVREELERNINKNQLPDSELKSHRIFLSILYIPEGERIAKKTLNPRLGIEGGISILGTTGYVIPISTKAWLDTIKSSLNFLSGNNISVCVFTPGRFSEKAALKILSGLPKEYFIEIGDYVSYSIRKASQSGINKIIMVGQFGKIVKISLGARNTNAKYSNLNLKNLGLLIKSILVKQKDAPNDIINTLYEKIINSNTSRQAYDYILSFKYNMLSEVILKGILTAAKEKLVSMAMTGDCLENRIEINIILLSYDGEKLIEI